MNLDLTEEHELLRRTVREFAEQRVAPQAEELDEPFGRERRPREHADRSGHGTRSAKAAHG